MNLPTGYESFEDLREDKCYYVDKTEFLYNLIDNGRYYFLSRPKRFGKTLLISTLECLFEGKKALFKDLYVEDKWDWSTRYSVIKMRFRGRFKSVDDLLNNIKDQFSDLEEKYDLTDTRDRSTMTGRLRSIIRNVHKKTGKKVVVLVDEYDAPILDALADTELAKSHRDVLNDLYLEMIGCVEHIRFMFFTGIIMLSQSKMMSGLGSIRDISLDPKYATICGYTENDFQTVFADEYNKLDKDQYKWWFTDEAGYYRWLSDEKVYNPFTMLTLFDTHDFHDFRNYWFEKGIIRYVFEYIKDGNCYVPLELGSMTDEKERWMGHKKLTNFDIDKFVPEALLFQAGYLTIEKTKEGYEREYLLKCCNNNVRNKIHQTLLDFVIEGLGSAKRGDPMNLINAMIGENDGILYRIVHYFFLKY
ncbi:MAG: AAA family ATPase [Proteobacteria bacterium]|nr:AAA family ATPase [Pseudomonadota bacterium]